MGKKAKVKPAQITDKAMLKNYERRMALTPEMRGLEDRFLELEVTKKMEENLRHDQLMLFAQKFAREFRWIHGI